MSADQADPLRIARQVTNQTLYRWPWMSYWRDEIESDACLGATTALLSHDPSKGANLAPRMHRRATGAVLDGIRDRAPVTRSEWAHGVRQDDLPPWRKQAESVEEIRELGVHPVNHADGPEDSAAADDRVDRILRLLHPVDAAVVRAYYLDGFRDRAIGAALGVTEAAVCKRRHKALAYLAERLGGTDNARRAS